MSTRYAFRTEALTREFEGGVRALDHLTLEVPAGIVFGFLGPNGAGKTTTIRLLLGLLEPTSGSAEVLGHDVRTAGERIRENTGALLEHHGLYERLSAYDNLYFYARVARLSRADARARVHELLDRFGLWDRREDVAGTWSRGMKQKLAIARALVNQPQLVFLDEPTAGLDPIAAATLRNELAALAEQTGTSIFLTTHNLAEAERLCARIGVVSNGRLIAHGHPDELRAARGGEQIEIVGRNLEPGLHALSGMQLVKSSAIRNGRLVVQLVRGASAAPVVAALVNSGAEIEEVRRDAASLEDVFMSLLEEPNRE
ncbi:MAG TPA: ABC transporter ATP-binding protein [Longimicrobiales bacterium]